VVAALVRDQVQCGAIEQEEALQLGSAQVPDEPLVCGRLVVRQELHGHSRTTYGHSPRTRSPQTKIVLSASFCTDVPQPRTRATYITAALDAGAPVRDVQYAVGHASPVTTEGYDRSALNPDRDPAYRLLGVLQPTRSGTGNDPQDSADTAA
jgi:hypothetical protein